MRGANAFVLLLVLLISAPPPSSSYNSSLKSPPAPKLGQTSTSISTVAALGTWSWGNKLLYSYDKKTDDASILQTYSKARSMGCNIFDTGDSYGTGSLEGNAEMLLKKCEDNYASNSPGGASDKPVFIAKIAPYPWLLTGESYYQKIKSSHEKLIVDPTSESPVFVPSLHWSPSNYLPFQTRSLYSGLLKAYETGLCTSVGFSNIGPNALLEASEYFSKKNIPIACNQIQCNLLSDYENDVERVVDLAKELGVTSLGYSPLGLGLLTGERKTRGNLRNNLFKSIESDGSYKDLKNTLKDIAEDKGASVENIAISWVRGKGLIPLVGCRDVRMAEGNFREVEIGEEEMERIDEVRRKCEKKGTRNVFMTG